VSVWAAKSNLPHVVLGSVSAARDAGSEHMFAVYHQHLWVITELSLPYDFDKPIQVD
jgi:hypothetical protein